MITEREKITLEKNYEISKKIYYLFKKYRNYNIENSYPKIEFNNNDKKIKDKKEEDNYSKNITEQALVKIKKENWLIKFIKRLFLKQ